MTRIYNDISDFAYMVSEHSDLSAPQAEIFIKAGIIGGYTRDQGRFVVSDSFSVDKSVNDYTIYTKGSLADKLGISTDKLDTLLSTNTISLYQTEDNKRQAVFVVSDAAIDKFKANMDKYWDEALKAKEEQINAEDDMTMEFDRGSYTQEKDSPEEEESHIKEDEIIGEEIIEKKKPAKKKSEYAEKNRLFKSSTAQNQFNINQTFPGSQDNESLTDMSAPSYRDHSRSASHIAGAPLSESEPISYDKTPMSSYTPSAAQEIKIDDTVRSEPTSYKDIARGSSSVEQSAYADYAMGGVSAGEKAEPTPEAKSSYADTHSFVISGKELSENIVGAGTSDMTFNGQIIKSLSFVDDNGVTVETRDMNAISAAVLENLNGATLIMANGDSISVQDAAKAPGTIKMSDGFEHTDASFSDNERMSIHTATSVDPTGINPRVDDHYSAVYNADVTDGLVFDENGVSEYSADDYISQFYGDSTEVISYEDAHIQSDLPSYDGKAYDIDMPADTSSSVYSVSEWSGQSLDNTLSSADKINQVQGIKVSSAPVRLGSSFMKMEDQKDKGYQPLNIAIKNTFGQSEEYKAVMKGKKYTKFMSAGQRSLYYNRISKEALLRISRRGVNNGYDKIYKEIGFDKVRGIRKNGYIKGNISDKQLSLLSARVDKYAQNLGIMAGKNEFRRLSAMDTVSLKKLLKTFSKDDPRFKTVQTALDLKIAKKNRMNKDKFGKRSISSLRRLAFMPFMNSDMGRGLQIFTRYFRLSKRFIKGTIKTAARGNRAASKALAKVSKSHAEKLANRAAKNTAKIERRTAKKVHKERLKVHKKKVRKHTREMKTRAYVKKHPKSVIAKTRGAKARIRQSKVGRGAKKVVSGGRATGRALGKVGGGLLKVLNAPAAAMRTLLAGAGILLMGMLIVILPVGGVIAALDLFPNNDSTSEYDSAQNVITYSIDALKKKNEEWVDEIIDGIPSGAVFEGAEVYNGNQYKNIRELDTTFSEAALRSTDLIKDPTGANMAYANTKEILAAATLYANATNCAEDQKEVNRFCEQLFDHTHTYRYRIQVRNKVTYVKVYASIVGNQNLDPTKFQPQFAKWENSILDIDNYFFEKWKKNGGKDKPKETESPKDNKTSAKQPSADTKLKLSASRKRHADTIYRACKDQWDRCGILPSHAIAQAIEESGCGESNIARTKHNLFGIMVPGSKPQTAMTFPSEYDGAVKYCTNTRYSSYYPGAAFQCDHAEYIGIVLDGGYCYGQKRGGSYYKRWLGYISSYGLEYYDYKLTQELGISLKDYHPIKTTGSKSTWEDKYDKDWEGYDDDSWEWYLTMMEDEYKEMYVDIKNKPINEPDYYYDLNGKINSAVADQGGYKLDSKFIKDLKGSKEDLLKKLKKANKNISNERWTLIEKALSLTDKPVYYEQGPNASYHGYGSRHDDGRANPTLLDCSSFTAWAYYRCWVDSGKKQYKIHDGWNDGAGQTTVTFIANIRNKKDFVQTSAKELKPGDIGLNNWQGIHVGIYGGKYKGGHVWIHCTTKDGWHTDVYVGHKATYGRDAGRWTGPMATPTTNFTVFGLFKGFRKGDKDAEKGIGTPDSIEEIATPKPTKSE